MATREQKIKELLEDFHSLKRQATLRFAKGAVLPRVTPSQWGALLLIEQHGDSSVKAVAEALCVTSSAATQLVEGLVASGYVARRVNPKDRRTVSLALSKKAKTQVEKMKKQAVQKFLKLFEALDDKEFNQYLVLNKKIVDSFSKK